MITVRRLAATGALVVAFFLAAASPAFAHASLDGSTPGAGETVPRSPTAIELRFDESVQVGLGGVKVFDGAGHAVGASAPRHPGGEGSRISVNVPHLPNGSYVVTWRVISADTHPVRGAFVFNVVRATANRTVAGLPVLLLNRQSGSTAVGVLFGIARFLMFAGLVGLVGGALFLVFVWPVGRYERRTRWYVWLSWWCCMTGTLLGLAVQGPYAAARSIGAVTDTSLWGDVLDTRFGKVWLARVFVLVLAAFLLRLVLRGRPEDDEPLPIWWPAAAGLVSFWLVATPALSGHAGTGSWLVVTIAIDLVHVAAAALWLGGLGLLAVAVLPRRSLAELRVVVPRFSTLAFGAVLTVAATGFLRAWREVGSFHNLLSTSYGHLVEIKLVAFGALVAFAVVSHRIVRARFVRSTDEPAGSIAGDESSDPRREVRALRRSVGAELVIAVVVLIVTTLLVNAAPAKSIVAGPYSKTLQTPHAWFDVQVLPAKVGVNEMHFTISDPTGRGSTVQNLRVQFELPSHGIAPITIPLTRVTAGHYLAPRATLPIAGDWRMTIKALVTDTDEATVTDTVPIR